MAPVKPGDASGEPNETTGLKSGGTSNPPERKATAAAWLTLGVLTILNVLNFIDRFLIFVDTGLGDLHLSLPEGRHHFQWAIKGPNPIPISCWKQSWWQCPPPACSPALASTKPAEAEWVGNS